MHFLKPPQQPSRLIPPEPNLEQIQEMLLKEARYVQWATRVIAWRAAIFKHNPPHYCSICVRKNYCRRLFTNGIVQDHVLAGKVCVDLYSVWNELFDARIGEN